MNPNLFESAEFYKRRYGSFSVYLIIPMVSLLSFCILFSLVNYKEITVQSVGELAPANRLAKIQSTSDQRMLENNLSNHQRVKKGQSLIVYSGAMTDAEIRTMTEQLAQLDKQILNLETLKQGILTASQTFATPDDFGYQSDLGSYLSQREVMQKDDDKANANVSLQNATVLNTQQAIGEEINALTAKLTAKRNKYQLEKDKEKREVTLQEIEQLEGTLSSLKTQEASCGTYQSLDDSLPSKLKQFKTEQLASTDKELVTVRDKKQELTQSLLRAEETKQSHQINAPESGILKIDDDIQHKKMIPTGVQIAEILPHLTAKTKLEVVYYVDSSVLAALKKGQKIRFASTKKLRQQLILTGRVKAIAKSATPIKGQNFFQVKAEIRPNQSERKQLIYGMQGRVSSVVDRKTFFQYYRDKIFGE